MSDALFAATVRLAHTKPALRKHLVPLLKEAKEEEARFEKGKPADPTKNMSEADKKEWLEQKEKNKDKFKGASLFTAAVRLAHENPTLRPHLLPILVEAGEVPEAFKKQWDKNKDKKDDKKDDKKPDFLKKKDDKKATDFDPTDIAEEESGPLQHDADEPYMADHFTENRWHEIGDKQESGQMPQAEKAASLRSATIRLAHSKPHLRPYLLPLLKD